MNPHLETSSNRERAVFLEALERPPGAARASFLDGACLGDAQLRAAVEALLANANDPLLDQVAEDARPSTGGTAMPQITFRGKTYNSEFEMPQDVRQAYQEYQMRETSRKPLTDLVNVPTEVEDVYKRALRREEQSSSSKSANELPTTEELYRQSAPEDMRHLPSDESVYRPSPPLIDPEHPTIEPDSGPAIGRLGSIALLVLIVAVAVFLVTQFLW